MVCFCVVNNQLVACLNVNHFLGVWFLFPCFNGLFFTRFRKRGFSGFEYAEKAGSLHSFPLDLSP